MVSNCGGQHSINASTRVIKIKLQCDIGIVRAKNFADAPHWREPGFLAAQRHRYQEGNYKPFS